MRTTIGIELMDGDLSSRLDSLARQLVHRVALLHEQGKLFAGAVLVVRLFAVVSCVSVGSK